jgi:hypothetical protein
MVHRIWRQLSSEGDVWQVCFWPLTTNHRPHIDAEHLLAEQGWSPTSSFARS